MAAKKALKRPKSKPKAKKPEKSAEKRLSDWRSLEVSTDEAGAIIKVSGERVRQLTKGGWIRQHARNTYRIGDVIDGYLAYRDDLERKALADTAQSRLAKRREAEIKQRMDREEGRLVPIEEVQSGVTQIMGALRFELSGVPAASSRDLDVRASIEGHLNAAIERCRAGFEKMEGDLRAGREVVVDGEEADA